MIYSLRGTLTHTEKGFVVVECGGVGYKCGTSMSTMRTLPQVGGEVLLYTYMTVREDAVELFGFATERELEFFKILTSVSGVGSKVGIAILSEFPPEKIAMCVASSDSKTLTRANGVGKKLADRIVLELKDKVKKMRTQDKGTAAANADFDFSPVQDNVQAAVQALEVLGYTEQDVLPVLVTMDETLPTEELIRLTLVEMGKR